MKPKVNTKPVSSRYDSANERTIEFSHEGKGGLISFRTLPDGTLFVSLYRMDDGIDVSVSFDNGKKGKVSSK